MFCPKCRREILRDSKFCPECGSSISGDSAAEGAPSLGGLHTMQGAGAAAPPEPSLGAIPNMGGPAPDISVGDLKTGIVPGASHGAQEQGRLLAERYEVLEEIGRGGFAAVFKGRDRKLGRMVAIKRLLPEKLEGTMGQQTLERFRREAEVIAQLNHRNIVGVYDHDTDAEGHYIIMEYVEGGALHSYLKAQGGKLPVPLAVELIKGIARGLGYAHRKNLIHRDIKPANVLLQREGEELIPKIVDFGLARMGAESELSHSGYGMGTPWYMPPEQRRNAKGVNHTADIYALGKTLYELVTGQLPDNVDPEAVPTPWLAKVILKCIKTNPEDRYFSAEDFTKDLDQSTSRSGPLQVQAAPATIMGNPCPACGTDNPPGAKYCGQCNAGLEWKCPECERVNSVRQRFCIGCGTDAESFGKVQETTARMERYLQEKKTSRVLKEAELVEELRFKPRGKKGQALINQINATINSAKGKEAEKERLTATIQAGWNDKQYGKLGSLLATYEQVADELPADWKMMQRRLPALLAIQRETGRLSKTEEHIRQRNWDAAMALLGAESEIPDSPDLEDGHKSAELMQRLSVLRARLPVLKAMDAEEQRLRDAEALRANGGWAESLNMLAPPMVSAGSAIPEDQLRHEQLCKRMGDLRADSEAKAVAAIMAKAHSTAKAQLDANLLLDIVNELDGLVLPMAVRLQYKGQLLQALNKTACTQDEWEAAKIFAQTWLKLAPSDIEAERALQSAKSRLQTYAGVERLLQLFRAGEFKDCAVLCQKLMAQLGGDFNIAAPEFSGPCSELNAQILQKQVELDKRLAAADQALKERRWKDAVRLTAEVLAHAPKNFQAQTRWNDAMRPIRRRKVITGV